MLCKYEPDKKFVFVFEIEASNKLQELGFPLMGATNQIFIHLNVQAIEPDFDFKFVCSDTFYF